MTELVIVERVGAVMKVTINRPDVRNSVDRATADALTRAFYHFDQDRQLAVAVLAGADGTFCAGADLKAFAGGEDTSNRLEAPTNQRDDRKAPMGPTRMILSKPVIAAVQGHAVAGGLELALWCDMRVMEESAEMGVYCRRWGVPLIDGGTVRLARLIGQSRAMDMILTGRSVGAQEAFHFGLANRVVADGRGIEAAVELAQQLSQFPQTCMRHDRLSVIEQWGLEPIAAIQNEWKHGMESHRAGAREGAGRFTAGEGRGGKPAAPAGPRQR